MVVRVYKFLVRGADAVYMILDALSGGEERARREEVRRRGRDGDLGEERELDDFEGGDMGEDGDGNGDGEDEGERGRRRDHVVMREDGGGARPFVNGSVRHSSP